MKKILAVDDSASIRQMVSFTLRNAGYEVTDAVDGKDGLGKARKEQVRHDHHRSQHAEPRRDRIDYGGAQASRILLRSHSHAHDRIAGGEKG